jgi:hypothetical protein
MTFQLKSSIVVFAVILALAASASGAGDAPRRASPFAAFRLPDAWQDRFWSEPGVKKLLAMDTWAIASLVPVQAGLRFCRCPSCGAGETENTLAWSIERPDTLTCGRCGESVTLDANAAKDKDKEKEKEKHKEKEKQKDKDKEKKDKQERRKKESKSEKRKTTANGPISQVTIHI